MAGPIGIVEGDHDWDFGFHYEWQATSLVDEQMTAEREVSYRRWPAGARVQGFTVDIPISMPHQGDFVTEMGVGRDGDYVLGWSGAPQLEWGRVDNLPDTNSGWGADQPAWVIADTNARQESTDQACWSSLPSLVPSAHLLSNDDGASVSSQGAAYFAARFCPGWNQFIEGNACSESEPDCDAAGNAVFDGGNDMYDIGNVMATSLMGTCAENLHDCALGSLRYRGNFEPAPTGCFGPGGSYRMAQLGSVWIFLAHNAGDAPLDFMVIFCNTWHLPYRGLSLSHRCAGAGKPWLRRVWHRD